MIVFFLHVVVDGNVFTRFYLVTGFVFGPIEFLHVREGGMAQVDV